MSAPTTEAEAVQQLARDVAEALGTPVAAALVEGGHRTLAGTLTLELARRAPDHELLLAQLEAWGQGLDAVVLAGYAPGGEQPLDAMAGARLDALAGAR